MHILFYSRALGVVVITVAQIHLSKPKLRFCAGSNPAPFKNQLGQIFTIAINVKGDQIGQQVAVESKLEWILTEPLIHLFPMQPFSTP